MNQFGREVSRDIEQNNKFVNVISNQVSKFQSRVRLRIENQYKLILIDTGSQFNLISAACLKSLGVRPGKLQQGDHQCLISAGTDPLPINGVVHLNIQVNDSYFRQKFYVIGCLASSIIIGCDFLYSVAARICFEEGSIAFRNAQGNT